MPSAFPDTPPPLPIVAPPLATGAGRVVARRDPRDDEESSGLATGMLDTFALPLARSDPRRAEVLRRHDRAAAARP